MSSITVKAAVLGPVQTNVYFIISESRGECVIVDPADRADIIASALKKESLKPVAILLTHGHFDHIGAVDELKAAFPEGSIRVYAMSAERRLLTDDKFNRSYYHGDPVTVEPDVWLEDGQVLDLLGEKIKVLHTPGHTEGGCCYYLESEKMLFAGDTLFCESVGRSDLPTGNGELLIKSIKEKILPLPDDVTVFPGHDELTTVGRERKYNPYLR